MINATYLIYRKLVLLTLASVALLTPGVHAATITPAMNDLILGFRAAGAPGQTLNLEVDLGNMSNFYGAAGSTIPLPGLSVQDLSNIFGTSWFTRADLFWGAVATTGRISGTPDSHAPVGTLWATAPVGSPAFSRKSASAQKNASAPIEAMIVAGSAGTFYGATSTTNSSAAAVVDATQPGSWTIQESKTAGVSFGFFNPTVDSGATVPVGGQVVAQLYEVQPSTTVGLPSTLLGNLILTRTGLSFQPAGGTATATIGVVASPTSGGTVGGAGTYPVGTNIQITATANAGWTFTGWNDSSTQSLYTITVPATNFTYTATFVQQNPTATIGIVASPTSGGTVHGAGTYPVGTNIQITATANAGWTFTGWNDGSTQSLYTITVPATNFNYTATFVQQTATIAVVASPTSGGTVHGAGTYPVGTNIQISATANLNWRFTGWSDGNTNATRSIAVTAGGATYTANFAALVSTAPPVIGTPPVTTNSLLAAGNRFVVSPGDTNVFTVGATDTVTNSLLRYQWDFGDGVVSAWSATATATHVYSTNNCGSYAASVTVSNTQFAIRSNLTVIAACQLTLTKVQVGVSLSKTNADSGALTAKLDLPGVTNVVQFAGTAAVVDIGNAQIPFTLDNKGRGVSAVGTWRLVYTKPTKPTKTKPGKPGYWTATITLSKGNWHSFWAHYGFDNATHKKPGVLVTLPVTVLVGNEAFAAEPQLHYIATQNKTGTAK